MSIDLKNYEIFSEKDAQRGVLRAVEDACPLLTSLREGGGFCEAKDGGRMRMYYIAVIASRAYHPQALSVTHPRATFLSEKGIV